MTPGARGSGVAGLRRGRLLVRVGAPPAGGRDKRVRIRSPQTLPATILA